MPDTLEDLVMMQPPTTERPLLGSMVLVVEDSRHACEALRLICQRSGARIRRAESLASAERHLRTYRPRLAVVDLGLPDGSGLDLIERLAKAEPRIDGIIAVSGDETLQPAALAAGADAFLAKPLASVAQFQKTAVSLMPEGYRRVPITVGATDEVTPDPIALRDDLTLAAELLRTGTDGPTLDYIAGFLEGLAKCTQRASISKIAGQLRKCAKAKSSQSEMNTLAIMIEDEATALEPV